MSPTRNPENNPENDTGENKEERAEKAPQSSGLPESSKINLVKLKAVLDISSDFDAWLRAVQISLTGVGLQSLIKYDLPRPTKRDAKEEDYQSENG
ncbi:hypothetical protein N7456_008093 [Penicillium angulare]|uniref:Uncharacterized protein n=1 Tax=Penicillium angulare TaxID=116970 RepID=A0A9W9FCE2_9EURO|nr:hypothetical protein N7456_008093 [Penicillium angulare]